MHFTVNHIYTLVKRSPYLFPIASTKVARPLKSFPFSPPHGVFHLAKCFCPIRVIACNIYLKLLLKSHFVSFCSFCWKTFKFRLLFGYGINAAVNTKLQVDLQKSFHFSGYTPEIKLLDHRTISFSLRNPILSSLCQHSLVLLPTIHNGSYAYYQLIFDIFWIKRKFL